MKKSLFPFVLCMVLLPLGCDDGDKGGDNKMECSTRDDCTDAARPYCDNGKCVATAAVAECTTREDCASIDGWANGNCDAGKCVAISCRLGYHVCNESDCKAACEADDKYNCGSHGSECYDRVEHWKDGKCENAQCIPTACDSGYHAYAQMGTCEADSVQNCRVHGFDCLKKNEGWKSAECAKNTCEGNDCCVRLTCEDDYDPAGNTCKLKEGDPKDCGPSHDKCEVANAKNQCISNACRFTCNAHFHKSQGGGSCDPDTNDACGAHDIKCEGATPLCIDGICEEKCEGTMCGGSCVQLSTNSEHCGSCDHACGSDVQYSLTEKCVNSMCVATSCDSEHDFDYRTGTCNERVPGQSLVDCGPNHDQCNVAHAKNLCMDLGANGFVCRFGCDDDYHPSSDGKSCEPDTISACGRYDKACNQATEKCVGGECVAPECVDGELLCTAFTPKNEKYKVCENGKWGQSQGEQNYTTANCLRTDVTVRCDPESFKYSCGPNGSVEVTCSEAGRIVQTACVSNTCYYANPSQCIHEGETIVTEGGTPDVSRCKASAYTQTCVEGGTARLWCNGSTVQRIACNFPQTCVKNALGAFCVDPNAQYVTEGGTPGESRCVRDVYKASCADSTHSLYCDAQGIVQQRDCYTGSTCYLKNRQAFCISDLNADCNNAPYDTVYCNGTQAYLCTKGSGVQSPTTCDDAALCGWSWTTNDVAENKMCLDTGALKEGFCLVADYVPTCDGLTGYYCNSAYGGYGKGTVLTMTCTSKCEVLHDDMTGRYPNGYISCDGQ